MGCTRDAGENIAEYMKAFTQKATTLRVPLSGSLEVTYRCNLRCVHCYLGHLQNRQRDDREMNTERILSLIDEITAAGCLYLLITGGEALVRDDFPEIYRHAKKNGLMVTVFTNGTLIRDEIPELFQEFPPYEVEISLYGASAETYERITRTAGSFERCMKGIERLLNRGIRVGLKTILMTLNSREFFDIENIAKDLGVRFRFDAAINPCLNGDKTPLDLRVSPEEVVEKEFSDDKRAGAWQKFSGAGQERVLLNALYDCGAGITGFSVDPYGDLRPCMMTLDIGYSLFQGGFSAGWDAIIKELRARKAGEASSCKGCAKSLLCGYCPGFFKLETGSEDICSSYLCAIGNRRFERINQRG